MGEVRKIIFFSPDLVHYGLKTPLDSYKNFFDLKTKFHGADRNGDGEGKITRQGGGNLDKKRMDKLY